MGNGKRKGNKNNIKKKSRINQQFSTKEFILLDTKREIVPKKTINYGNNILYNLPYLYFTNYFFNTVSHYIMNGEIYYDNKIPSNKNV